MKIKNMESIYEEGFTNGIISSTNIEQSCEDFFSSKLFRSYMDNRVMQTKLSYDEVKDESTLVTECYVNIPIYNRYGKRAVLYNYYKLVKYTRVFRRCEMIDEEVEILD